MGIYYILDDDNEPVAVDTVLEWGKWFEDNRLRRVVSQDFPRPEVMVSTVFLGIDHRFIGDGPPILFETIVCRAGEWGDERRYTSWAEAERGHEETLKMVMEEE